METIRTKYIGDLRTEAEHVQSGNKLLTDAPCDNKGKGETFSPTDLLATAIGSCILTIMGITALENNFSIDGSTAKTTKIMADNPRRVAEVIIEFDFSSLNLVPEHQAMLKKVTKTSPVPLSVHPELKQTVTCKF